MAGYWTSLTNSPAAGVCTSFLLTDGTVLCQGVSTKKWYRLTPSSSGSYINGTWTTVADSANGPLYYASGILRDGRLIIAGGEYNFGSHVDLDAAEIYNPVTNAWTTIGTPAGWTQIGDAPCCVLPDGRFLLGQIHTKKTAVYDPVANSWTATADKISNVSEESWALLPDETILSVDCSNPPHAEKYVLPASAWVAAGSTPSSLVDSLTEIGASVLLPDGRVLVIGATGMTALYTMPAIANQPGSWASGPNIPPVNPGEALGAVDAPAALLPNGKVLVVASPITTPATFQSPTYFFEYDPGTNTMTAIPRPTNAGNEAYWGRMLVLPNGQLLWTAGSTLVEIYTPDGTYDSAWRPSITSCPTVLHPGFDYTLHGRQLNGLSQCVYYGDDASQATNYPIVRLKRIGASDVHYCRTFDFSTLAVQTGTVVHSTRFSVPSGLPIGSYRLIVIANGIPSAPCTVQVSKKHWKELKWEIKEIKEHLKFEHDLVAKREFEFLGKEIAEGDPEIIIPEETWLDNVRRVAVEVDRLQGQLDRKRAFISPEERPEVGVAPLHPPKIRPRKATARERKENIEKRAFAAANAKPEERGAPAKTRRSRKTRRKS